MFIVVDKKYFTFVLYLLHSEKYNTFWYFYFSFKKRFDRIQEPICIIPEMILRAFLKYKTIATGFWVTFLRDTRNKIQRTIQCFART